MQAFMNHLKERAQQEGALAVQDRRRRRGLTLADATSTASRCRGTRPLGCLLLHGFTATPDEVRPLGEALAAAGFPVRAVRLAGHGTTPADLARHRLARLAGVGRGRRWRPSCATTPRVAVAGVSLGALLALLLAARRPPEVAAVVCGAHAAPARATARHGAPALAPLAAAGCAGATPSCRSAAATSPTPPRVPRSRSYDVIPLPAAAVAAASCAASCGARSAA